MTIILLIMIHLTHLFSSAPPEVAKSDKKPSEVFQKEPFVHVQETSSSASGINLLDFDIEFPPDPEPLKEPAVPEPPLVREIAHINPSQADEYPGGEKVIAVQKQEEYSWSDLERYSADVLSQADQKIRTQPCENDVALDKEIARTFMSFEQFMNESLYNKVFGYYTTRVKFGATGDFATYPLIMAPAFGGMIAYQAYAMWRSMIESRDITDSEPFYIIEFGAGNGQLAHDVLYNIEMNIKQEKLHKLPTFWDKFMQQTQYIIGEISPELRKQQAERNELWTKTNKLQLYPVDARDIKTLRRLISPKGKPIKGMIVTNELPDAFGVHIAHLESDGSVRPLVVVPIINKGILQKVLESHQKKFFEIEKASNGFLQLVSKKIAFIDSEEIVLSSQEWIDIKELLRVKPDAESLFDRAIKFKKVYVCPAVYPEIVPYTLRHSGYFKKLSFKLAREKDKQGDKEIAINFVVEEFMNGLSSLLDKGFVMTIDYGDHSMIHEAQANAELARVRGYKYGVKYYPFDLPGSGDITSDINFTDLAIVGRSMGLKPIFFGIQSDLAAKAITFAPCKSIAPFNLESVAFAPFIPTDKRKRFFGDTFKLLIQKKGLGQSNIYNIEARRLPLVPPE